MATIVRTGKTSAEPVTTVLVHYDTNRYDLTVKTIGGAALALLRRPVADGWRLVW